MVKLNSDDDEPNGVTGYGTPDKDQDAPSVFENDMVTVEARTYPELHSGTLTLGPDNPYGYGGLVKLWRATYGSDHSFTGYADFEGTWDLANGPCPLLYGEGRQVSTAGGDAALKLAYTPISTLGPNTSEPDVVPITVQPRYGESESWISLWKHYDPMTHETSEPCSDPVGGNVYVALYVKVGAAERMAAGQNLVRLRVKD